jgi:hypothetical protein
MPQDSLMPAFFSVFGLISSVVSLAAFVIVIVTCFKVMRYVDQKTISQKLK